MTQTPGPDEKICPFCAEVIRAAAVKCRYCHSDLPVEDTAPEYPPAFPATGTAHDIRETPVLSEDVSPWATGPTTPAEPSAPLLSRATSIMLVVCLVLAVGIVALVLSARPDDLRTAENGQVTSETYRSSAMSAAAANVHTVLSYSYKTLDEDKKAARAVITPSYAKEYADVMDAAGSKATKAKLTQETTVMATSLISLKKGSAKLLVFANRVTTAEDSKQQVLNQDRLLVEMKRDGGDWVVSKLNPF